MNTTWVPLRYKEGRNAKEACVKSMCYEKITKKEREYSCIGLPQTQLKQPTP